MTHSLTFNLPWVLPKRIFQKKTAPTCVIEQQTAPKHFLRLARHDNHSLEIKTLLEPGAGAARHELSVHLFVPTSFQLTRWPIKELYFDLASRLRLAFPLPTEGGAGALRCAKRTLQSAMEDLQQSPQETTLVHALENDAKQTGALLSETLKQLGKQHARSFRLAHSLFLSEQSSAKALNRLSREVRDTVKEVATLREALDHSHPTLELLDEFSCNLMVKYLGKLHRVLQTTPRPKKESFSYRTARESFEESFERHQQEESAYQRKGTYHKKGDHPEQHCSLMRLGQLKKYFQSTMFVDVQRRQSGSRWGESAAIAGTATAGIAATLLQTFNRPEIVDYSMQGAFVVSFGVLAYTLRDRAKDWLKRSLQERAKHWSPDFEVDLQADGMPIGNSSEWISIKDSRRIDAQARKNRQAACSDRLEAEMHEDVLEFKKCQKLVALPQHKLMKDFAIQDNIRLNIARYLKHMDDPTKELAVLDCDGRLSRRTSRKIYHFYLHISSQLTQEANLREHQTARLFRIILDKNGIDSIEPVKLK